MILRRRERRAGASKMPVRRQMAGRLQSLLHSIELTDGQYDAENCQSEANHPNDEN